MRLGVSGVSAYSSFVLLDWPVSYRIASVPPAVAPQTLRFRKSLPFRALLPLIASGTPRDPKNVIVDLHRAD
jgi:hypothetical protein